MIKRLIFRWLYWIDQLIDNFMDDFDEYREERLKNGR